MRRVLRDFGRQARKLAWIDFHTGLGPTGVGERILACEPGVAEQRARAVWGPAITSIHDDSSTSSFLTGPMWTAARDECPQADYIGIALEYGTAPLLEVLQALRADNWLQAQSRSGAARPPDAMVQAIGRQMMRAFHVDTDEWKTQVIEQGRDAMLEAM